MTLTFAHAPFAPSLSGCFNFDRDAALPVLFWEPFQKRLRVAIGGDTVVDSRRVMALHETGKMMRLCVPGEDVRRDMLNEAGMAGTKSTGRTRRWSARDGAERVAVSFEEPPEDAPWLAGFFAFDLAKANAWWLEDEQGYAHPRDPYHRFDVLTATHDVAVFCGDVSVATCARPIILFETSTAPRYYLPPDAIRTDLLTRSDLVTPCPYKGPGQHWHLKVGDVTVENAAWSLPEPLDQAERIRDWFCFYPEKVTLLVDSERLTA